MRLISLPDNSLPLRKATNRSIQGKIISKSKIYLKISTTLVSYYLQWFVSRLSINSPWSEIKFHLINLNQRWLSCNGIFEVLKIKGRLRDGKWNTDGWVWSVKICRSRLTTDVINGDGPPTDRSNTQRVHYRLPTLLDACSYRAAAYRLCTTRASFVVMADGMRMKRFINIVRLEWKSGRKKIAIRWKWSSAL